MKIEEVIPGETCTLPATDLARHSTLTIELARAPVHSNIVTIL